MARFDNTVKGIGRLLKRLKEQDATVVVCEVTDGYERPLVTRLRRTEITMHVVSLPKEYVRISVQRFCPVCPRTQLRLGMASLRAMRYHRIPVL